MNRQIALQERSMCDYSLHAVASRPAEVAETLVSTKFRSTTTRGFASPDTPTVAVCLRPGTELAFETDVRTEGFLFRRNVQARLARFRQIGLDYAAQHDDAPAHATLERLPALVCWLNGASIPGALRVANRRRFSRSASA